MKQFYYGLFPPLELEPELPVPLELGLVELPELLEPLEPPYAPPWAPEGSLSFEPAPLVCIFVDVPAPEGSVMPAPPAPSFPCRPQPTSNAATLANTSIFFIMLPSPRTVSSGANASNARNRVTSVT